MFYLLTIRVAGLGNYENAIERYCNAETLYSFYITVVSSAAIHTHDLAISLPVCCRPILPNFTLNKIFFKKMNS